MPAPARAENPAQKRKRSEVDVVESGSRGTSPSLTASQHRQLQQDILLILRPYDTTPSFLHFDGNDTNAIGLGGQPPKKARLSGDVDTTTSLSANLTNAAYSSLKALKDDVARLHREMTTSIRSKAKESAEQGGQVQLEMLKQIQQVDTFARLVKDVVEREEQYQRLRTISEVREATWETISPKRFSPEAPAGHNKGLGSVLTLFGNAPTPKQLFSSTQTSTNDPMDSTPKPELPVEELSLPTGLTATNIIPAAMEDAKPGPTFDESFPPSSSLPPLLPPKTHRRSTTRDPIITWDFGEIASSRSKKGGFTVQSQTVGDWVGYGGVDTSRDAASPRERRKQRDRALSSGESAQLPLRKPSVEGILAKSEEALFRRAYSTFAPSSDNSKSVVSEGTKSMIWWQKVGDSRFCENFAIDPALLDHQDNTQPSVHPLGEARATTDEDFGAVVVALDKPSEDFITAPPVESRNGVDRALLDVSQLLETLASYQRIRNAMLPSLTGVSHTPVSPTPLLASGTGKPNCAAEDEVKTYHSLRHELTDLLLRLPPYAVAKLDGDQLRDLGVSKLINFEGSNIIGTMEEDQVARLAKHNALATAAGISVLARSNSSSQHYSTTAQRTPAIGQAANTRYSQAGHYGAARTPATAPQFSRSTASAQSQYGTPGATAPRSGYGQPSQHVRSALQSTFSQANGHQHYGQRPQQTAGSYSNSYGQQYGQMMPTVQHRSGHSSSQPLAQYQQRSYAAAQNSVAFQTSSTSHNQLQSPSNRSASPAKPSEHSQQGSQRPTYTPPVPPNPRSYAQPSSDQNTAKYMPQPQTSMNSVQSSQPPPTAVARQTSTTPQLSAQVPVVQTNGHS